MKFPVDVEADKTEVRVNISNWVVAILDAHVQGSRRKISRDALTNEILCEWAKDQIHVSRLVANRAKEYGGR